MGLRHVKLGTLLASAFLVVVMTPGVSHADEDTHQVLGLVQLASGQWLGIDAGDLGREAPAGTAWVMENLTGQNVLQISVDCVHVSWYPQPYPFPPYLPYHRVEASGVGADGQRYHMAAYDWVSPPLSYGDYAALSLEPGDGTCGAPTASVRRTQAGDVAIFG